MALLHYCVTDSLQMSCMTFVFCLNVSSCYDINFVTGVSANLEDDISKVVFDTLQSLVSSVEKSTSFVPLHTHSLSKTLTVDQNPVNVLTTSPDTDAVKNLISDLVVQVAANADLCDKNLNPSCPKTPESSSSKNSSESQCGNADQTLLDSINLPLTSQSTISAMSLTSTSANQQNVIISNQQQLCSGFYTPSALFPSEPKTSQAIEDPFSLTSPSGTRLPPISTILQTKPRSFVSLTEPPVSVDSSTAEYTTATLKRPDVADASNEEATSQQTQVCSASADSSMLVSKRSPDLPLTLSTQEPSLSHSQPVHTHDSGYNESHSDEQPSSSSGFFDDSQTGSTTVSTERSSSPASAALPEHSSSASSCDVAPKIPTTAPDTSVSTSDEKVQDANPQQSSEPLSQQDEEITEVATPQEASEPVEEKAKSAESAVEATPTSEKRTDSSPSISHFQADSHSRDKATITHVEGGDDVNPPSNFKQRKGTHKIQC